MGQKKQNQRGKQITKKSAPAPTPKLELAPPLFKFSFKVKAIILVALAFVLYANSLGNQFALDDGIVIVNNAYVQEGFSGIGKILTHDAYDSWYRFMHASQMLAGGRYRPLSIVVFAIEQQIFGNSWFVKHLVNVLFYMLCIFTIFYFLRNYLLKKVSFGEDCAFIATLLFIIHPLHTEVVDNVKSLDEIMSLTLILSTFIFSLKYFESNDIKHLIAGMVSFFLALLAKEYAVMLIILLPVLFYTLTDKKISGVASACLPYLGVLVVYIFLRKIAVGFPKNAPGNEILNNPYLLATHTQQMATQWFVLGKYVCMLFFPYPLSSDYSYNVITYKTFTDPGVLLSIAIYIALVIWGLRLILKRNILALPVFFYLVNIAIVSNFLLTIGATMGERLAFHSSFGFVVLVSYYLLSYTSKLEMSIKRVLIFGCLIIVTVLCGAEVFKRNPQWKNDITLFTTDVHTVPNSILVNGNAGARYVDLANQAKDSITRLKYLDSGKACLIKSIRLHKKSVYVTSYLNLGITYSRLLMPDSAAYCYKMVLDNFPDYPGMDAPYADLVRIYATIAHNYADKHNYRAAIDAIVRGTKNIPKNADIWDNLGGVYFTAHLYDSAKYAWTIALQLNPKHPDALKGMSAIQAMYTAAQKSNSKTK